jgi:hypothetical protein
MLGGGDSVYGQRSVDSLPEATLLRAFNTCDDDISLSFQALLIFSGSAAPGT